MRICDGSSDVCSSDLPSGFAADAGVGVAAGRVPPSPHAAGHAGLRRAGIDLPAERVRKTSKREVGMKGLPGSSIVAALAFAFSATEPMAATAYVSNEKSNTISVVDLDRMEVTATVPVGQRPRGITLSHDGRFLYICASDEDHVEVLDLESLHRVRPLPPRTDPQPFL